MQRIDRLLESPCYIIDFLPQQVPKDCKGQFFKVEDYLIHHIRHCELKSKWIRILLKIMCYYPISVYWGEWIESPPPEQVVEIIDSMMENRSGEMNLLFTSKNTLLQFGWDCLHISIYNPDEEMCELLQQIAVSEGLFWRKAE